MLSELNWDILRWTMCHCVPHITWLPWVCCNQRSKTVMQKALRPKLPRPSSLAKEAAFDRRRVCSGLNVLVHVFCGAELVRSCLKRVVSFRSKRVNMIENDQRHLSLWEMWEGAPWAGVDYLSLWEMWEGAPWAGVDCRFASGLPLHFDAGAWTWNALLQLHTTTNRVWPDSTAASYLQLRH